MINTTLEPTNFSNSKIATIAENFKKEINYLPGDRLACTIERMGGKIIYKKHLEDDDASLVVHSKNDFDIYLFYYLGFEREYFQLCHILGHYVLHSNCGEKYIIAANWDENNKTPEYEANIFATNFTMPENEFVKHFNDLKNIDYSIYIKRQLAEKFKVSEKMVNFRLEKLNLKL